MRAKEYCNWRRYILIGTPKEIEKYLEISPIDEEDIVKKSNINSLKNDYKKSEFPDCVRGITLQSTDIILINTSDDLYDFFKGHMNHIMKLYPCSKMNPRIYRVDV